MRLIRLILIFLLGLLCLPIVQAQSKVAGIAGVVIDAQTGEPLTGAVIKVLTANEASGVFSDTSGHFYIKDIPVGYHDIIVSFIGYESLLEKSVYVSTGRENMLELKLTIADNSLEDIVITSSPSTTSELSLVSLQPQKQGERLAGSFNDVGRMLLTYAGVKSILDGSNQLVVRGTGPLGFSWRLNGVPMPDPNHFSSTAQSGGAIGIISTYVLDKADFYSGAIPASMGNALSGVMDMQLRKGDPNNTHVNLRLGLVGLDAMVEGPLSKKKKASYLFNYRFSTITVIEKLGINIHGTEFTDGNVSTYFQDFVTNITIPLKNDLYLQPYVIGGVSKAVNGFSASNLRREDNFYLMLVGGIKLSQVLNSKWKWKATYATDYFNFKLFSQNKYRDPSFVNFWDVALEGLSENAKSINNNFSAEIVNQYSLRQQWRAGALFQDIHFDYASSIYNWDWRDYDADGIIDTFFIRDTGRAGSSILRGLYYELYADWQFRVNEKWLLIAGMQFNQTTTNKHYNFEPRVSIRYRPALNHKLTLASGLQSKMLPYSYYGALMPWIADQRPNRNLDFEKVFHVVGGYHWQISPDFALKAEVYYQYLFRIPVDNPRDADYDPYYSSLNDVYPWYWKPAVSMGKGRNYGMELTFEKSFSHLYYIISTLSVYSTRYKTINSDWEPTIHDGRFIFNISGGRDFPVGKNKGNLISLNSRLIWAGGGRYRETATDNGVDYFYTPGFQGKVKDYFRWDFKVGYKKNKQRVSWDLSAEMQNLTNTINEMKREFDFVNKSYNVSYHVGILPNLKFSLEF